MFALSFVLFEVFDVDGSDFPRVPRTFDVKLVDPPHQDAKRLIFGLSKVPPVRTVLPVSPSFAQGATPRMTARVVTDMRPRLALIALPRASLLDADPLPPSHCA
ncbi:MAG: hypothetical protein HY294_13915 [Candidatus Rokubacteria bacterium]|nr:hypothetical protein [Candidatus Rokubacteria bacterium]